MKTDWETFQTAYQNAPQELKDLVDSERIPVAVSVALQQQPGQFDRRLLTIISSLFVLKALSTDEVLSTLEEVGVNNNLRFLADLKESLSQPTITGTEDSRIQNSNLADEIAEVEHEIESLHSVRTMAEDMQSVREEEEQTHKTSQSDILTNSSGETPPSNQPQPSTTPQWGSEN